MSAPRLVATDLDGTVVRSDGTISDRTRRGLAAVEEAGAVLVLVTGRPPRWMPPIVEATGHRGVAICANGALVYDLHTAQVVRHSLITAEAMRAVVEALQREAPGIAFAVERHDTGFAHEPSYRPRWDSGDPKAVRPLDELLADGAVKLLGRHDGMDADELLAVATRAVGDLGTLTHSSSDGLLEISATGVSKASGLASLAQEHGIAASEVVAFGDMPNDLPMLAWAGHSVAVANAHPDVLAASDEVTASNDDDGVAQVLARWF
ncbi:MAG: HAD family phosphatase [Frankiaceae bacterium]|nr:HAD family phosphatase [Frankiaceae bacterium]